VPLRTARAGLIQVRARYSVQQNDGLAMCSASRPTCPLERIVRGAASGDVLDPGTVVHPEDVAETARRVGRVLQPG
jgi:hypothetical protein